MTTWVDTPLLIEMVTSEWMLQRQCWGGWENGRSAVKHLGVGWGCVPYRRACQQTQRALVGRVLTEVWEVKQYKFVPGWLHCYAVSGALHFITHYISYPDMLENYVRQAISEDVMGKTLCGAVIGLLVQEKLFIPWLQRWNVILDGTTEQSVLHKPTSLPPGNPSERCQDKWRGQYSSICFWYKVGGTGVSDRYEPNLNPSDNDHCSPTIR